MTGVTGTDGGNDDRHVAVVGFGCVLGHRRDVQREGAVGCDFDRGLPLPSVVIAVTTGGVPEVGRGGVRPRCVGPVPTEFHLGGVGPHVGVGFRRGALKIDAGIKDGVLCRVIHGEAEQQTGFVGRIVVEVTLCRGVVSRVGRSGHDVGVSVNTVVDRCKTWR